MKTVNWKVFGSSVLGGVAAALSFSCVEPTTAVEVSSLDNVTLNAAVMEKLRKVEQGCTISTPVEGGAKVMFLHGSKMPLRFGELKPVRGRKGTGREWSTVVTSKSLPGPIGISCWVPGETKSDELLSQAMRVDWKTMYARLRHAPFISNEILRRPLSPEARQYQYEFLGEPSTKPPVVRKPALRSEEIDCYIYPWEERKTGLRATRSVVDSCTCFGNASWNEETEQTEWHDVLCIIIWSGSGGGNGGADAMSFAVGNGSQSAGVYGSYYGGGWGGSGFSMPATLARAESEFCGYSGCYGDGGYSGDQSIHVSLTASQGAVGDGGPHSISFQANISNISLVTEMRWNWVRDWGDYTTTTQGACSSVPDTTVCHMQVYGPGRMDLEVVTGTGSAFAFARIGKIYSQVATQDSVELTPPECPPPARDPLPQADDPWWRHRAWCQGALPSDAEKALIKQHLAEMRTRGTVCEAIAEKISNVLGQNKFRILPDTDAVYHVPFAFGGFGSLPRQFFPDDSYMGLTQNSMKVVDPSQSPYGFALSHSLAHEGDHLKGNLDPSGKAHLVVNNKENPWLTPNTVQCGGSAVNVPTPP